MEFEAFLCAMIRKAGAAALPYFRNEAVQELHDKATGDDLFDPVTRADKAVEAIAIESVQKAYPEHGVIAEESGVIPGNAYDWIIDPIDGTRAFLCGIPTWGVLIALAHNGLPLLGAMFQPYANELFYGDGVKTALVTSSGKQKLKTRKGTRLSEAFLMTTSPFLFPNDAAKTAYHRVEKRVRLSRYGCDCYAYGMLAAGQVDLVIESGLKTYDLAALLPIVRGAGGVATSWNNANPLEDGTILAAGSPELHAEALAALQSA